MNLRSMVGIGIWLACLPVMAQTLHFATEDFEPFNWGSAGKATGPMVEVVQSVCQTAGLNCPIEVLPWRRALAMAEDGQLDGVFALMKTPAREKKFFFTHPVVRTSLDFFVPATSNWRYRTPDDLSGMTLVVYGRSGSSSVLADMVTQIPDARMETELSHLTAFRKLASGRYGPAAAVFGNRDGINLLLQREGLQDFKSAGQVMVIEFSIGMSRKKVDPAVFQRFNAALGRLRQSGQVRAILEKYRLEEAR